MLEAVLMLSEKIRMNRSFLAGLFDSTTDQRALSSSFLLHLIELLLLLLLLLLKFYIFLVLLLKRSKRKSRVENNRIKTNMKFLTFPSFFGAFKGFFLPPSRPVIVAM